MGFEKLISFLSRNLAYNSIEELKVKNSCKKILCNHIIFDLNFIIYYCILELEEEINDIMKIIYSLPFNYGDNIEEKMEKILKRNYREKMKLDVSSIFDGNEEEIIAKNFRDKLNSLSINNVPFVYRLLYWKIFYKINEWIENFHIIKFVKSINIFFDGIPSFSKILEQRRRRTKNYLESNIRKKIFDDNFNNMENDIIEEKGLIYNYFSWLHSKYSISKSIGPTSELTRNLENFLNDKLKNEYSNKDIYINSGMEFGEADNKIFKYIYNKDLLDDIVIHSCDSDLVHQTLIQQTYFNLIQKSVNLSVIRYYTRENEGAQLIESKKIIKHILKKYNDVGRTKISNKTNYCIILDLMILFNFFGNDNLPSSLEFGPEISLNQIFLVHKKVFSKCGNIVNLKNDNIELNLINLKLFFEEFNNLNSFSTIILNRYYKLPYQLINFLVEKLNLTIETLEENFLNPYYIYEGYNCEVEGIILEDEDLRKIYYNKYKKSNNEIPHNPLDIEKVPDNFKKIYINNKVLLDKYLDFYNLENNGLPGNQKIQLLDENSYQDLYKFVHSKTVNICKKKYKQFVKPYLYDFENLKDSSKILKIEDENDCKLYLKYLYYQVKTFFGDMSNYNSFNFIHYPYHNVPSIKRLIKFIDLSDIDKIYETFNEEIKDDTVDKKLYFDNISHHLFITPYLKCEEDYIRQIKSIPQLRRILDELIEKEGSLWFKDVDEKFNYRMIDIRKFLKNWKEILIRINLENKDEPNIIVTNMNKVNSSNELFCEF